MKKILLFFYCALCIVHCALCQPANINLSNTSAFEGEPFLAINPTNHQNIVVAWMAADLLTGYRVAIKSKTSFDGGATWGNQFVQPHFGATWHSADVSMAFRSNGFVYLSYIDYHEAPDSGGVYITHSVDGGISWSSPVQVWNGITEDSTKRPLDRPWLAVDNSGTSTDGMFYLTTKPAPWISPPNRPYLKTSADSGQTWSAYRYIDTTAYLVGNVIAQPMAAVAVAADGTLCVAYPSYLSSQSLYPKIFFAKSYSRGATFQYHDLLVNPSSVADTNYKLGYRLAANPSTANQLCYVYVGNQNGDPDIFVSTTSDGGMTWNSLVRVNDDSIGNGVAQDMVWASYNSTGDLVVVWRDRRNGAGTGFFQPSDTYCAMSHDNGATFKKNIRLSNMTAPFDSILMQKGNDFMSCQLINDSIYAAWGDVRNGYLNIYFTKTSDSTGFGSGVVQITSEDDELFFVYPNPVKKDGLINICLKKAIYGEMEVYNESGEKVYSQQLSAAADPSFGGQTPNSKLQTINCKLNSGIYFIDIKEKNKTQIKKIIVE
jgi:hypothetical protein